MPATVILRQPSRTLVITATAVPLALPVLAVRRELAAGPDGTDGVSHLLAPLALFLTEPAPHGRGRTEPGRRHPRGRRARMVDGSA